MHAQPDLEPMYTLTELAAMWRCSERTILRRAAARGLRLRRVGRRVMVPRSVAEALVQER